MLQMMVVSPRPENVKKFGFFAHSPARSGSETALTHPVSFGSYAGFKTVPVRIYPFTHCGLRDRIKLFFDPLDELCFGRWSTDADLPFQIGPNVLARVEVAAVRSMARNGVNLPELLEY